MSSLVCCIWWLVFGILLGWLLAWWFSKYSARKSIEQEGLPDSSANSKQNFNSPTQPSITPPPIQGNPKGVAGETSREDMLKAANAAGISFAGKKNDLEIIEGIGPKIAELLNNNGIHSFAELSHASIDLLNSILEQGGDRFRLANPGSWPKQAALAAENHWEELKNYQDHLDGGIEKS